MDEIIKINNGDYKRYEDLLLKRDALEKEAGIYMTMYIHEFGPLISDVFKAKIDCIRKKKAISFCTAIVNRGEVIDQDALNDYLKKEMALYEDELQNMLDRNEACKKLDHSPEVVVQKVKRLYHKIAKLIHPDINPETAQSEELLELWGRCVTAYNTNSLKEMTEVDVLVHKYLSENGLTDMEIEIPDISDKINALEEEIKQIVSTDPYQYKFLLNDKDAVEAKKKALNDELETYNKYLAELDETMNALMANGVKFTWKMN